MGQMAHQDDRILRRFQIGSRNGRIIFRHQSWNLLYLDVWGKLRAENFGCFFRPENTGMKNRRGADRSRRC